jgi:hypothetical protein
MVSMSKDFGLGLEGGLLFLKKSYGHSVKEVGFFHGDAQDVRLFFPRAVINPLVSSAKRRILYGPSGLSERPAPRLSKATICIILAF